MAAASSAVAPSGKVSALEKLISDEPEPGIERPHPLLANRLYTKVGQNRLFEVRPGVLHFSGFKPNQLHRQVVRVVNRTSQSQSVNIIGTTTPYFKVSCRKRGAVAPGMAEEIFVEFTPTEWRYYCDCIRLHNDDENLVIPVHAYPTMAEAFFPKHVDFGRCQLGKRYSKTVKLHSSIPVQFEFRVEVLQPLPEVSVEPLEGIIPPNGPATITVHFLPARLSTYSAQIRVSLSQFNSEPVICTVTGSGFPGLNRPAALDAQQDQRAQSSPVAVMQRAEKRIQEQRMKILQRGRGPSETQRELNVLRTENIDELLGDGLGDVQLGTNLHAHGKVNAVLTEGGLSKKSTRSRSKRRGDDDDVTSMNDTADIRRLQLEKTSQSHASQRGYEDTGSIADDTLGETKYGVSPAGDVTVYDDENVSDSLKHMLFEAQLGKFLSNEKSKSLSIKLNVGEDTVSDDEVAFVMKKRALLKNEKTMRELEEAVNRREPEVVPPDEGCVLVMSDERESISGSYEPLFNKFDADKGALKTRVLQRFRSAVNRVIVQLRTVNRFRRIRELLAKANFDGDVAEDMSKMEIQASVGEDGPLEEAIQKVATMKIRVADPFPYRGPDEDESYATCLHPVSLTSVSDPDPRREFAMAEMQRYKIMGYELQEFDAVDTSAPPMAPSILLEGAAEESPSLMRTVAAHKDSQEEEAGTDEPEAAGVLDHTQLRVPHLPSPSPLPPDIKIIDGSLMTVPPRWGVDEGYLLEPKALAPSTEHAGSGASSSSSSSSGGGIAGVSTTTTVPAAGVDSSSSTTTTSDSKLGPAMTSVTEPCWLNTVSSLSGRPKLSDIWWPRIEPWFNIPELPPMMDGPRKEDLTHLTDDSTDAMIDGPLPGALHDPMSDSSPGPKFTLETVKEIFDLSEDTGDDTGGESSSSSGVKSPPPAPVAATKSSTSAASGKSSSGTTTGKSSGAAGKSTGAGKTSSSAAVVPAEPVFSGKAIAEAIRGETSHKLIEKLDKLLVNLRSRQLEEVVERKRKVNSLLKDPGLRI